MSTWQPLPWQRSMWQRFNSLVDHDKLSHAVVLSGQVGTGKEHFARAFAQRLYCDVLSPSSIACGHCASCHQYEADTVSDFRWIEPEPDASSISVDQIRSAIDFLELSRDKGRKKIAMISPADRMTVNAANSLLKSLEEPPGDALIMLLAAEPERLPITVRSRCQVFSLSTPSLKEGEEWLSSQGYDDATLALDVSGHAPLAARAFCDEHASAAFQLLLDSLFWNVSANKTSHDVIAVWLGFDVEQLLGWMVLVSEWMVRQTTGDLTLKRHAKELAVRSSELPLRKHLERHERLLGMKRQRGVSVNRDLVLDQLQIVWSFT